MRCNVRQRLGACHFRLRAQAPPTLGFAASLNCCARCARIDGAGAPVQRTGAHAARRLRSSCMRRRPDRLALPAGASPALACAHVGLPDSVTDRRLNVASSKDAPWQLQRCRPARCARPRPTSAASNTQVNPTQPNPNEHELRCDDRGTGAAAARLLHRWRTHARGSCLRRPAPEACVRSVPRLTSSSPQEFGCVGPGAYERLLLLTHACAALVAVLLVSGVRHCDYVPPRSPAHATLGTDRAALAVSGWCV